LGAQNVQLKRQVALLEVDVAAREQLPAAADSLLSRPVDALSTALQGGAPDAAVLAPLLESLRDALTRTRTALRTAAARSSAPRAGSGAGAAACEAASMLPHVLCPGAGRALEQGLAELAPRAAAFAIALRCHVLPALSATPPHTASTLLVRRFLCHAARVHCAALV